MKILMINVVCGIRSTGRICADLATALEAQGHEVKIAYGREDVPEQFQKYAVRIGSDLDVKLHGVKARLFDASGFGSKRATEKFIEWVKEYNPDVIHLHNIHGYYINIEVLFEYLKTCGKKIIWTLHDCWAFTGHTAYCDAIGCEKWKKGCSHCTMIRKYPKSYIDRSNKNWEKKKKIFTRVSNLTIITPSYWLEGLVKESFLSEYPVQVIHNGIDTSKFHPIESEFRKNYGIGDRFMILGVATAWDDMKGLHDFIKLSELLDDNYQIVLVGLTRKQITKLPNNVLGIERTNSVEDLVKIYSAADLYANLSYTETFGLTNVEAQLCGTRVLSYDSGALGETVGISGIIVQRGDTDAIVTVLEKDKNDMLMRHVNPAIIDEIDISNVTNRYINTVYQN